MIINPAEIVESDETVRIQSLIEYSGKKEYLWYSFPKKYRSYLTTEKLDGFLVGLLFLAMKRNDDILVKGAISEKLYFNLTHGYMEIIKIVKPGFKKINISVQRLDNGKNVDCKEAVVTGFSAGVDSFCTLHDHYFNATSPRYKITHLLFNNVGSHGEWDSEKGRKLFNLRYDLLKGYPHELGIDFIKVDSNLSDILRMDFTHTHEPRNVSVVLLLQKLFSKYFYSSGDNYKNCRVEPGYDTTRLDPVLIPLLSTETLECISTGSEHTRVEKTKRMANVPNANRWLNVCVHSVVGENCSVCWKCCRTLLTLELLGVVDKFEHVFNLELYRKTRTGYPIKILGNKDDPYMRDVLEYAQNVGYSFKPWQVVAAKFYHPKLVSVCMPLIKFVKSLVKKR